MAGTFVACGMTDCRWNEDGQCQKRDIFVDRAAMCASFEPEVSPLGDMGLGGPRASFRDLLAGGGVGAAGPPMGAPPMSAGAGPPIMGGPPPML